MAFTAGSPKVRGALLEELTFDWDAVVLDHVQSGWALDVLDGRLDRSTVVVHVSHNDERTVRRRVAVGTSTSPTARLALELDARKVATLEDRLLRTADLVTSITYDDAAALEARRGDSRTVVLTPGYEGARLRERQITDAVPRRAVIAGSLLWRVKQFDLLALLRVADARFAEAGAEIVVIGEAPAWFENDVRRTTDATTMVGRVESFAEEFGQARLALVSEPHGGGFKLKTLDYAFQRVPLFVQTGSVTGLPLRHGHGLLEFADIEALVDGALERARRLRDVEPHARRGLRAVRTSLRLGGHRHPAVSCDRPSRSAETRALVVRRRFDRVDRHPAHRGDGPGDAHHRPLKTE